MAKQSEELTEFYRSYLSWVESGARDCEPYSRYYGLCSNLERFTASNRASIEMSQQFRDAKLHPGFPFGEGAYDDRSENGTQHEDPNRLAWVKEHANL